MCCAPNSTLECSTSAGGVGDDADDEDEEDDDDDEWAWRLSESNEM
jgi:hypothetical protein